MRGVVGRVNVVGGEKELAGRAMVARRGGGAAGLGLGRWVTEVAAESQAAELSAVALVVRRRTMCSALIEPAPELELRQVQVRGGWLYLSRK